MPVRPDLGEQDFLAQSDPKVLSNIAAANQLVSVRLTETEIRQLIDFLHALTDPALLDLRHDVPRSLPSGMPLHD